MSSAGQAWISMPAHPSTPDRSKKSKSGKCARRISSDRKLIWLGYSNSQLHPPRAGSAIVRDLSCTIRMPFCFDPSGLNYRVFPLCSLIFGIFWSFSFVTFCHYLWVLYGFRLCFIIFESVFPSLWKKLKESTSNFKPTQRSPCILLRKKQNIDSTLTTESTDTPGRHQMSLGRKWNMSS
jgi:hypothetical protein